MSQLLRNRGMSDTFGTDLQEIKKNLKQYLRPKKEEKNVMTFDRVDSMIAD